MHYDPVKDFFMQTVKMFPPVRKIFFALLDMLFLRNWYVRKQIKKYFKKEDALSFYDAGAGFCQYSDYILSKWQNSTAFALDLKGDYLELYAKYAENKYPKRFTWTKADLVNYLPETKFNLIAAIDILEHIENDEQVIRNFYSCLQNGGKLIISTPSDLDEASKFTEEHVRPGYSKDNLINILEKNGLSVNYSGYSYGKWGALSWKIGIKLPLGLVNFSKLLLLLLPIYYILSYPFICILMWVDINSMNYSGNGIIIVAEKKS
jgi:SAM-dependent methyltransferase